MKEKKKDFIKLLGDLCNIYKDYIKEHKDSKLDVLIQDNMIKIYLYKEEDVVDEFGLAFNHKERDVYTYLSVVIMKMLFSGKMVYGKDNVFYENMDGTGFKIIVNDEDLFNKMFGMVSMYRDIDFYEKIDNGRKIRNKVNKNRSANILEERVQITRKLIQSRSMK